MYNDNDDSNYKNYCYECDSHHKGWKCEDNKTTIDEAKKIIKEELFMAAEEDYKTGFNGPESSAYRNGLRFALKTLDKVADVNAE